jgi:hypothetical protein
VFRVADYFAEPVIGNRTVKDAAIRLVWTRLAVSVPSRSRISGSIAPRRLRRRACPGLSDGCPARRPGQAQSGALLQLATGPARRGPACMLAPLAGILSAFRGPSAVAPAWACLPHPAGSGPCGKLGEAR